MSETSDFSQIIQIMSNTDNIENRIRMHPSTSILKMNTNIHINISSGYEYE
jgi:hypothetical protein